MALGIDDPEEWLEHVSPRTLALWEAFYRFEPWGADYERSAMQMHLADANMSMLAATVGQKRKTLLLKDFMPRDWAGHTPLPSTKPKGRKQLRAAQQICAAMFPTADKR